MKIRTRITLTALALTAFCLAPPTAVHAQVVQNNLGEFLRTNPKFLDAFREIVAAPSQFTVRIRSDSKDAALGVILADDGWILSKAFDLKGRITCRLKDGREFDAKIVGVHPIHDLAMLKIEVTGLPFAQLKPSKTVAVGSWVASVGVGDEPVAVGVVSVPTREVVLKGLPVAASELSKIGYLGVALESAKGAGVRVMQVMPGTPAAKAGLQTNDIIVSVSGVVVNDQEQFQGEMMKRKPGDQVTLRIRRGSDELTVEATLQQRPPGDNRGELQNLMGSELSARRSGYPTILTHDSVVKPADCGGPLVDLDGNVIGINISRAGRTETWVIPTEVIQPLLADLKSGKLALAPAQPPAAGTGPALTQPERPNIQRNDRRQDEP